MKKLLLIALSGLSLLVAGAMFWRGFATEQAQDLPYWRHARAETTAPKQIYHLGHSLVGRDMPAMLAQLGGHDWHAQLGWGASLRQHWQDAVPGHAEENASPAYRPAAEALASGAYPVLVMTEMVELRDALRHHDAVAALSDWARAARAANPDIQLYAYETWHSRADAALWLKRLEQDLPALWEQQWLVPAAKDPGVAPVYLIPGGQVMAAFAQAAAAQGLPGVGSADALFRDEIHFNDLGAYLMALTHYAVIYQQSPEGLPHLLHRADGTLANAPDAALAAAMQRLVWQVVQSLPQTGILQTGIPQGSAQSSEPGPSVRTPADDGGQG